MLIIGNWHSNPIHDESVAGLLRLDDVNMTHVELQYLSGEYHNFGSKTFFNNEDKKSGLEEAENGVFHINITKADKVDL